MLVLQVVLNDEIVLCDGWLLWDHAAVNTTVVRKLYSLFSRKVTRDYTSSHSVSKQSRESRESRAESRAKVAVKLPPGRKSRKSHDFNDFNDFHDFLIISGTLAVF